MGFSFGGIPKSPVQELHSSASGRKKPFQTSQELYVFGNWLMLVATILCYHPGIWTLLFFILSSPTTPISDHAYGRWNHLCPESWKIKEEGSTINASPPLPSPHPESVLQAQVTACEWAQQWHSCGLSLPIPQLGHFMINRSVTLHLGRLKSSRSSFLHWTFGRGCLMRVVPGTDGANACTFIQQKAGG